MRASHLRSLTEQEPPFVSVHIDDSHDTENAEHELSLRWRAVREDLVDAGAEQRVVDLVEDTLLRSAPPVGASGRSIVATKSGVHLDARLVRPPVRTVARHSALPYLVPLIEHGVSSTLQVVAVVDHTGADVLELTGTSVAHRETVDGVGTPVHHASGAETAGPGDPQRRSDEQSRKNIAAAVDHLCAIVDRRRPERVYVVGETTSLADLHAAAPSRLADVLHNLPIGARGSGLSESDILAAVAQADERRRNEVLDATARRFDAEIHREEGLAVEGLTAVCGALRNGEVDTLVIGDIGDATVVDDGSPTTVAPTAANLSELGAAPERVLRADEALPMLAIATDADLVRVDERVSPTDGVGALLRYLPRTSAGDR